MAAPSPVTIESSPTYEPYQAPSITPDTLRRSASATSITRSSPQLLSPSSFVRPRPQPLKSGSRIQQVPAGAQAGFATASSIWKQSKAEDTAVENGTGTGDLALVGESRQSERRNAAAKSTGKLMKPKRTLKSGNAAVRTDDTLEHPLADISFDSREKAPKLGTEVSKRPNVEDASTYTDTAQPRRPSLNLSEYSFNADILPAQTPLPAKVVPPTTSVVRKRSSKKTKTGDVPTTKKPRKPKAKSEAIILDSDEPEEVLDGKNPNVTTEMPAEVEIVAKKPRPRKTKEASASRIEGEHATVAPAAVAKKRKMIERPTNGSIETSAYFEQPLGIDGLRLSSPPPAVTREVSHLDAHILADATNASIPVAEAMAPPAELASRRRRSWTPAKDSFSEEVAGALPAMGGDPSENLEQVPFSALLGNFTYLNPETGPSERSTSGEASTKRRRIELSDQSGANQPHNADTPKTGIATKAGKSAKKPKALPKKPQTVTALSLAAYQPQKEQDPLQSTVSNFFSPQKEVEKSPVAKDGTDGLEPTVKAKKPRKSRAKAPLGEGDSVTTKKPAKSKSKATKVKVKFDKTEHVAPLYSPSQARKQMTAQDFIFGTSSQLAADESPDFLRDMQLAIQQSELACALPRSSQIGTQPDELAVAGDKSCARVPSAPHGTCLSVEQARRDLWCASARDSTGSKLAPELPPLLPEALPVATNDHFEQVVDVVTLSSSGQEPRIDHAPGQPEPLGSELKSASSATGEVPNAFVDSRPTVHNSTIGVMPDAHAADEPAHSLTKDDWTILRSDDSVSLPQASAIKPLERFHDLATSPARRTALQSLDANISMAGPDSIQKSAIQPQARSFSTTAATLDRDKPQIPPSIIDHDNNSATAVSPKRGRGRPRKGSSPERSVQTSPARGRGRPRKNSLAEDNARTSPAKARGKPRKDNSIERNALPSQKRPVGRPRKETAGAGVPSTSPKRSVVRPRKNDTTNNVPSLSPERLIEWPRQKSTTMALSPRSHREIRSGHPSASQPTPRQEWTRIDDISDTEPPTTPSPRRRRASSSPAHILPLDFEPPLSPSDMPKVAVAGSAAMKATDATWPAIQASIFPQIAEIIKSAPLGEDIKTPSWHEKILLYDPIVLEDLTAWLNGQGLRTEVQRLKTKTKTRGRKKKDAPPEVDEWETVRDELKAWMVQKWCEDNSICCLWKEGLRGGVKARY